MNPKELRQYILDRQQSLLTSKQEIEANAQNYKSGPSSSNTDAILCLRSRLEELALLTEWLDNYLLP
jgi:hypothetical protein